MHKHKRTSNRKIYGYTYLMGRKSEYLVVIVALQSYLCAKCAMCIDWKWLHGKYRRRTNCELNEGEKGHIILIIMRCTAQHIALETIRHTLNKTRYVRLLRSNAFTTILSRLICSIKNGVKRRIPSSWMAATKTKEREKKTQKDLWIPVHRSLLMHVMPFYCLHIKQNKWTVTWSSNANHFWSSWHGVDITGFLPILKLNFDI